MEQQENAFRRLFNINVANHVEKKGQFNYLSWPFAVAQLRLVDPAATWEVRRFDGLPYLLCDAGVFVEVAVTVTGVTLSQIHPVLDARNRPIMVPTSFDINTSIQRCLVKAIALHGLGLSIYAGEDLPDLDAANDDSTPSSPNQPVRNVPNTVAPSEIPPRVRQPSPSEELLTANQLRFIKRLLSETGLPENNLLGFFGYDCLENIPKREVNRVIQALEQSRRKEAA